MAATYLTDRSRDIDQVRAALGDTDVSPAPDALFQDEEIAAVLVSTGSVSDTVAQLASELVARFARKPVSIKAGDVAIDYSTRLPAWRDLAARGTAPSAASSLVFVPVSYGGADALDEFGRADCRYW